MGRLPISYARATPSCAVMLVMGFENLLCSNGSAPAHLLMLALFALAIRRCERNNRSALMRESISVSIRIVFCSASRISIRGYRGRLYSPASHPIPWEPGDSVATRIDAVDWLAASKHQLR